MQFLFVQIHGLKFIRKLAKVFTKVWVLEQCNNFYKLRVAREDKTIGHFLSIVQENRQEMNIEEFSVNQTSLEQIFASFAHQRNTT